MKTYKEAYYRETSKLWKSLMQFDPFEFVSIDDILEELYMLREENKRLHDIIDEDIAAIKQDLEVVAIDTEHNRQLISRNEHMISNVSNYQQVNF